MPPRLRLSWDMKTWKLFLLSVLESLEFGWQVIRYALIFVSAFFRQRASLGCAMVAMRSQLTFYKESIRVSPLVGVAVHGVSAPTFRGMASRSQSSTSSQSAQQQPNEYAWRILRPHRHFHCRGAMCQSLRWIHCLRKRFHRSKGNSSRVANTRAFGSTAVRRSGDRISAVSIPIGM